MHSFIIFVYIGIQQLCEGGCWKSCNCSKFHGILNAIDLDIWELYNNKFIPVSRYISCISPFFWAFFPIRLLGQGSKWSQMSFPRMEGKFYNWIILNLLLYVGWQWWALPNSSGFLFGMIWILKDKILVKLSGLKSSKILRL